MDMCIYEYVLYHLYGVYVVCERERERGSVHVHIFVCFCKICHVNTIVIYIVHLFSSVNLCILIVIVVLVLQIRRLRDQVVLKSHVNFWPLFSYCFLKSFVPLPWPGIWIQKYCDCDYHILC